MKLALQLYSVRDCIKSGKDMFEVLKKVKAMGYEGVEFAGYAGLSPEEVRKALDEAGLTAVSSHEGIDRLESSLNEIITYTLATGAENLVCAGSPTKTAEDMIRLERVMKTVVETADRHGIHVGYHNHSHEFEALPDGTLPMEQIEGICELEVDTYWVFNTGRDPAQYLKDHADEITLVHLKDGDGEGHPCAIGEGVNHIAEILKASDEIGVEWVIVENDDPLPDGLSDVKRSIDWIKKNVL